MQRGIILIWSEGLGEGDDVLGGLIMANFLRLLGERESKPRYLICWNAGVKLMTQGSRSLEHLRNLEQAGVDILACRTCCEFFGIEEQIAVGRISGMPEIQELLLKHSVLSV